MQDRQPDQPTPAPRPRDATIDPFVEHRRLLFGTAYHMLGSVADAEDILQDAWLKWHAADQTSVEHPKSYLVRTVTNLALNRLTSARATRETYLGPWLPEPLITAPNAAEETEMADTVSTAMLVVLETLNPTERAVFVLREVFGYSCAEIGGFLDRPEATVRQISHRARSHMQARRPRFETDEAARQEITEKFMAACHGGDLNALMELLAPEVTLWNDGGGIVTAARRPLHGPDHVARWLLGVMAKPVSAGIRLESAVVNGELSIVGLIGDYPVGVLTYDIHAGHVENIRFQVNPQKLGGIQAAGDPS
ncbi:RNA polymerase sigma-70 factor [Nocardia sputorum]|uniref:RNA polymerase sigma24 factor n=1 Tax=Nocardia sputorum TaxID=2984338 RepID=A0ABM8CWY2_9NOCA|nr:RNA polymerase sigma-70 factor [Nocardia sputorum]BDT90866.1 RNA polymerase sigma24 factor [Nocardia sputorum]BDT99495.1 RNA polymerase sigma24 factor [Nocardia sputorum]